jgi:hypothetical protein
MNLVYGITVSTEIDEIKRLVEFLTKNTSDKIVVQVDNTKNVEEVVKSIQDYDINIKLFDFNGDFSSFKNNLNRICKEEENADYIFQLDADEMISEYLVKNVREIINMNMLVDLYYFPRINTVDGITYDHIKKWNWKLDSNERINFPDYQGRLFKSHLYWSGKVHEKIVGGTNYSILPTEDEYSIFHHKNIDRQEKQNQLYSKLL